MPKGLPSTTTLRVRYCPRCNCMATMDPMTGVFHNGVGLQHKQDCPNHPQNKAAVDNKE